MNNLCLINIEMKIFMKVSSIIKNPVARKVTNSIKLPMRKAIAGAMMMTAVLGGTAVANAKTTNNDRE